MQKRLFAKLECSEGRYLTLPELRCTFGSRSVVPDIVVVSLEKITLNDRGEPEDNFTQLLTPHKEIEIYRGHQPLQGLDGVNLKLTAEEIFGWLKLGKN